MSGPHVSHQRQGSRSPCDAGIWHILVYTLILFTADQIMHFSVHNLFWIKVLLAFLCQFIITCNMKRVSNAKTLQYPQKFLEFDNFFKRFFKNISMLEDGSTHDVTSK
jgi:hypothetical protein